MSPEDAKAIQAIIDMVTNLSGQVMSLMASNTVLTAASGALFAEMARVSGKDGDFDAMLERLMGVLEAQTDSRGRLLSAADELRSAAEAMAVDLGVRG